MKYCEKEVDLETTGEGVGDPSLPDTDNDLMDVGASLHARVNRCSTTVDRTHGDHVKGVAISLVVIILLLLVILLLGGG